MGEFDHEKDGDGRIYESPIMPELTFPPSRSDPHLTSIPSPQATIQFNKPGDRPGSFLEPAEHMKEPERHPHSLQGEWFERSLVCSSALLGCNVFELQAKKNNP